MCFGKVHKEKENNSNGHELSIQRIQRLEQYQYVVSQSLGDRHPQKASLMTVFEISYQALRTPTGDNVIAQFGICEEDKNEL